MLVKLIILNPDFAYCLCSSTRLFTDDRKSLTLCRRETFTSGNWPVEQSTWPQCWKWVTNTVSSWILYLYPHRLNLMYTYVGFPSFPFQKLMTVRDPNEQEPVLSCAVKPSLSPCKRQRLDEGYETESSDSVEDMLRDISTRLQRCPAQLCQGDEHTAGIGDCAHVRCVLRPPDVYIQRHEREDRRSRGWGHCLILQDFYQRAQHHKDSGVPSRTSLHLEDSAGWIQIPLASQPKLKP